MSNDLKRTCLRYGYTECRDLEHLMGWIMKVNKHIIMSGMFNSGYSSLTNDQAKMSTGIGENGFLYEL